MPNCFRKSQDALEVMSCDVSPVAIFVKILSKFRQIVQLYTIWSNICKYCIILKSEHNKKISISWTSEQFAHLSRSGLDPPTWALGIPTPLSHQLHPHYRFHNLRSAFSKKLRQKATDDVDTRGGGSGGWVVKAIPQLL